MDTNSYGTQFDFTYAPGTSQEQIIGFEMAGAIWSSYLQDNVTVRIHVESTDQLPDENIVGAALPAKEKDIKYDKLREHMQADRISSDDYTAYEHLPHNYDKDKEFTVFVNGEELDKTKEFRLTNANAKALDLLDDDRKKLDGYIVVNDLAGTSAVGWDYDALRNDTISNNSMDFVSVAMHEIGHVLGFVSGIDDSGWLEVLAESRYEGKEIKEDDFKFASSLDLFRYSNEGEYKKPDLSNGGNPFFSIDGGISRLGNFANGEDYGGDGYQASHWQQDSNQGIMNPIIQEGERKNISPLDLTAMDVIGWNVNRTVVLDWGDLYAEAVASSETANIMDRSKDVEKMIKKETKNQLDGRRSWSGRSFNYSWQIGMWQHTTIEVPDIQEEILPEVEETEVAPQIEDSNTFGESTPETVFYPDTTAELDDEDNDEEYEDDD